MLKSVLITLGVGAAVFANAAVYDAAADFSFTTNPNGAWSYGGKNASPTDSFVLGTVASFNGWNGWAAQGTRPFVGKTTTAGYGAPAGTLAFHTGVAGSELQYAVLRWTADSASSLDISGIFYGGDTGGVDDLIYKNGTSIYSDMATINDSVFNLTNVLVNAGDTIDFMVGPGVDGANSDSTPFSAQITTNPVPEPASMAALGLGVAALLRRRRKQ